jgi:dihydroneopterin aldolase
MASELNVAASWDVTSDSLSAIYAHESGAARLLLIKSVDVDTAPGSPSLVDPCFASHAAGLDVFIAGPAALEGASEILARGGVVGFQVFHASSSRKIAS